MYNGVSRGFQMPVYRFGCTNYVLKFKKADATQHLLFNLFNANVSTPSQTFNLSNALKLVKLKDLMYACVCCSSLFKCIINYHLYKQVETLHSTGAPQLTPGYFIGVYAINRVTILIASVDVSTCLNIR